MLQRRDAADISARRPVPSASAPPAPINNLGADERAGFVPNVQRVDDFVRADEDDRRLSGVQRRQVERGVRGSRLPGQAQQLLVGQLPHRSAAEAGIEQHPGRCLGRAAAAATARWRPTVPAATADPAGAAGRSRRPDTHRPGPRSPPRRPAAGTGSGNPATPDARRGSRARARCRSDLRRDPHPAGRIAQEIPGVDGHERQPGRSGQGDHQVVVARPCAGGRSPNRPPSSGQFPDRARAGRRNRTCRSIRRYRRRDESRPGRSGRPARGDPERPSRAPAAGRHRRRDRCSAGHG